MVLRGEFLSSAADLRRDCAFAPSTIEWAEQRRQDEVAS
jgi:hypothetical protein